MSRELTAAQLALLDQAQAAAMEDLAVLVARSREVLNAHPGPVGVGKLKLFMDDEIVTPDILTGFLALAVARIVKLEDRDA